MKILTQKEVEVQCMMKLHSQNAIQELNYDEMKKNRRRVLD